MRPSRGTAVRVLFALVVCFATPAWSGESDEALLVSPGSAILDGLQTMSVGSDVSTLFEAREIFRLAHRDDAVTAIDRHLARVAAARAGKGPMPDAHTIGEVLAANPASPESTTATAPSDVARVDWAGADRAGVERARQWLRSIGCERRGTCRESEARGFLRDPKLLIPVAAAGAGIAVGLFFGMMRRFRIRSALGVNMALAFAGIAVLFAALPGNEGGLVLIVLLGYGVLVVPPYLAALLLTLGLMKRWRPDRAPRAAVPAPVE